MVAVEVTDGASEVGGATTCGVADSTVGTGVFTGGVGDAGATDVTTGATVDCVTGGAGDCVMGGAGGATACCVCGGDSMLGAAGSGAGAFGGASGGGAWVASVTGTFGSGAGAVVVTTVSVSGLANAGAIPPVSAVREITTPDARTATTLRLAQIPSGAPMCVDSSYLAEQ